jgi:hypothetical protein
MICTEKTGICQKSKRGHENNNVWCRDQSAFSRYHDPLMHKGWQLLIPFTANKASGEWRQISRIVSCSCSDDPDYKKCRGKYNEFVSDFYGRHKLFYLLHFKKCGKIPASLPFVPTFFPNPEAARIFFDIQKCYVNLVFRKHFLNQNQIGFVIFIIKRLSVRNISSVNMMYGGHVLSGEALCSKISTERIFNWIFRRTVLYKKR